MSLSSVSVRARRLIGAGVAVTTLVAGSVAVGVVGSAQAVVAPVFSISPSSGAPGDQVVVSGTACAAVGGVTAHVFLYQGVEPIPSGAAPLPNRLLTGTIAVSQDGTWSATLSIPAEAVPGPLTFLANCANANSSESAAPIFWYGQAQAFELTDGTTTTEGPTTTVTVTPTTEAPTTTADPATTTTAAPAARAAAVTASPAFTG